MKSKRVLFAVVSTKSQGAKIVRGPKGKAVIGEWAVVAKAVKLFRGAKVVRYHEGMAVHDSAVKAK